VHASERFNSRQFCSCGRDLYEADITVNDSGELGRHIGLRSAIALVIANVIGAGIFTTTGFQAADLDNPILMLSPAAIPALLTKIMVL
jgi:hypothetical protein